MKCEECGGTGKVQKWFYERTGFGKYEKVCGDVKCEWCNGTGEVEQTEQEYLQTCTTEQLADVFFDYRYANATPRQKLWMSASEECIKTDMVEWLKQPHSND